MDCTQIHFSAGGNPSAASEKKEKETRASDRASRYTRNRRASDCECPRDVPALFQPQQLRQR